MNKKYTIKDIAKLSGVSKGTVDRVLHNRGKVSKKALDAVNKVLKKIDYQPNLIARNLKNNKTYRVCVLMPNPKKDSYWQPSVEGVHEAITIYKPLGIFIELHFFNPNNAPSFVKIHEAAFKSGPQAILLPILFYQETMDIIKQYNDTGIIYSVYNDRINSDMISNFVGQDLFKSGKIAASLLHVMNLKPKTLAVVHVNESFNNSTHMQLKEQGFKYYFKDTDYNIITIHTKTNVLYEDITNLLNTYNISGILVSTSKTFEVANAVEKNSKANIKIIGYDLLDENIEALKKGTIDFLIHQNPKQQTLLALTYISEYFLFDKPIPEEKLLPIDIINSENIDSYIN